MQPRLQGELIPSRSFPTSTAAGRWPSRPALCRGIAALVPGDRALFDILLAVAADEQADRNWYGRPPLARFVDGQHSERAPLTLLPAAADGTAAAFLRRAGARFGGGPLGFVADQAQSRDPRLFRGLRRVVAAAAGRVGGPIARATATVFVDAAGLHRHGQDTAARFILLTAGELQLRSPGASPLAMRAGDAALVPPGCRCAERAVTDSAGVVVSVDPHPLTSAALVLEGIEALAGAAPPAAGSATATVDWLQASAEGTALHEAVARAWLRRISASGFARVPPPRSATPAADALLRADLRFPVAWLRSAAGIQWAANGHVHIAGAGALPVLAELGRGGADPAARLRRRFPDQAALIDQLYAVRAIDEVIR